MKTKFKSLDCSIMELADDVAYGVHDLEDGVALGLLERADLENLEKLLNTDWGRRWEANGVVNALFPTKDGARLDRKWAIGSLVHALLSNVELKCDETFESPILRWNAKLTDDARAVIKEIHELAVKHIIKQQAVQTLEYRGRYMVSRLFDAIESDPLTLMPDSFRELHQKADTPEGKRRVICDYVAGMTDNYATKMFERLFIPREGTVFEKL